MFRSYKDNEGFHSKAKELKDSKVNSSLQSEPKKEEKKEEKPKIKKKPLDLSNETMNCMLFDSKYNNFVIFKVSKEEKKSESKTDNKFKKKIISQITATELKDKLNEKEVEVTMLKKIQSTNSIVENESGDINELFEHED